MKTQEIRHTRTQRRTNNPVGAPREWNDAFTALTGSPPMMTLLEELGMRQEAFAPFKLTTRDRGAFEAELARCIPTSQRRRIPAFLDDLQSVIALYRAMRYCIGITKSETTRPKQTLLARVNCAASALTQALAELNGDVGLNTLITNRMEILWRNAASKLATRFTGTRRSRIETTPLVSPVTSVWLSAKLLEIATRPVKHFRSGRLAHPERDYLLVPTVGCLRMHYPILFKNGSLKSNAVAQLLLRLLDIAVPAAQKVASFQFPLGNQSQHSTKVISNPSKAKAQLIRRTLQSVDRALQAERQRTKATVRK